MSIEFKKKKAFFKEVVGVEEAESLLQWISDNPSGKIDLNSCTHLHSANLQVLIACKPFISAWPQDTSLRVWLENSLINK